MTSEMARLTVVFKVAARRSKEVVAALRFLMATTRLEPGCRNCGVWIDSDSAVRYLEEWATEIDLREHVRGERFASLLSVIESRRGAAACSIRFRRDHTRPGLRRGSPRTPGPGRVEFLKTVHAGRERLET